MQRQESLLNLEEDGESNDSPQEIHQEITVADEKNPIVTTTHLEIKDFFAFCRVEPELARTSAAEASSDSEKEFFVKLSFNQELSIKFHEPTIRLLQDKECICTVTTPYGLLGITAINERQFAIAGRKNTDKESIHTIEIWEITSKNKLTQKQCLGNFYDLPSNIYFHAINANYLIYKGLTINFIVDIKNKQFIRLPSEFRDARDWRYDIFRLYPLIDGQTFYCVLNTGVRYGIVLSQHALLIQDDRGAKFYKIRESLRLHTQLYLLKNGRVADLEEQRDDRSVIKEGKSCVTEFAHIKLFQTAITNLIKELFTNHSNLIDPLIRLVIDYLNADVFLTQSQKNQINNKIPNPLTFFKNKKPIDAIELKDPSVRLLKSQQPTSSCCIVS